MLHLLDEPGRPVSSDVGSIQCASSTSISTGTAFAIPNTSAINAAMVRLLHLARGHFERRIPCFRSGSSAAAPWLRRDLADFETPPRAIIVSSFNQPARRPARR